MSNRLQFGMPTWIGAHDVPSVGRASAWSQVRAAWRRYRTRQQISELTDHMLKDIGVSFAEAEAEANKPFWRE